MRIAPLIFTLLLACTPALAQQPQSAPTLPDWDALTPAQRETLIAPLRQRWNDNPEMRAMMMKRAQDWQSMSPQMRQRAQRGMHRWEGLSPEQRMEARALFHRMRLMTPEQRSALRDQWKTMTPEQRRAWLDANPPPPRP